MNLKLKKFIKSKEVVIAIILLAIAIVIAVLVTATNSVTMNKIWDSYLENPTACREKYNRKEVSLKGEVSFIYDDLSDEGIYKFSIDFESPSDEWDVVSIDCSLNTNDSKKLKNKVEELEEGMVVTVKGTIRFEEFEFGDDDHRILYWIDNVKSIS